MTANKKESELQHVDTVIISENGQKVLERERKLEALLQEQVETIALLQEARERIDRQGKTITTLSNSLVKRDEEIDRLNKVALESSVPYQQVKAQNTILIEYLRTWLQTFESKFDSDEDQEVTEAHDYLTHAKWMEVNCGRNCYGFIRRVQEWYDSQPAWKQRPKVSVE